MECRVMFALAVLLFLLLHPIGGAALPYKKYHRSKRTMEESNQNFDSQNTQLPAGRPKLDIDLGGKKISMNSYYQEEETQANDTQNEDNVEPDLSVIPLQRPSKPGPYVSSLPRSQL